MLQLWGWLPQWDRRTSVGNSSQQKRNVPHPRPLKPHCAKESMNHPEHFADLLSWKLDVVPHFPQSTLLTNATGCVAHTAAQWAKIQCHPVQCAETSTFVCYIYAYNNIMHTNNPKLSLLGNFIVVIIVNSNSNSNCNNNSNSNSNSNNSNNDNNNDNENNKDNKDKMCSTYILKGKLARQQLFCWTPSD